MRLCDLSWLSEEGKHPSLCWCDGCYCCIFLLYLLGNFINFKKKLPSNKTFTCLWWGCYPVMGASCVDWFSLSSTSLLLFSYCLSCVSPSACGSAIFRLILLCSFHYSLFESLAQRLPSCPIFSCPPITHCQFFNFPKAIAWFFQVGCLERSIYSLSTTVKPFLAETYPTLITN